VGGQRQVTDEYAFHVAKTTLLRPQVDMSCYPHRFVHVRTLLNRLDGSSCRVGGRSMENSTKVQNYIISAALNAYDA
jgi:hypothetical protein